LSETQNVAISKAERAGTRPPFRQTQLPAQSTKNYLRLRLGFRLQLFARSFRMALRLNLILFFDANTFTRIWSPSFSSSAHFLDAVLRDLGNMQQPVGAGEISTNRRNRRSAPLWPR